MPDAPKKIYPTFILANNQHPNRLYAFPLIGFLVKIVFLIPVLIEMFFLGIVSFLVLVINWFVVLITGKYWDNAYKFFLGLMRLSAKIHIFIFGLTDKYPGFTF